MTVQKQRGRPAGVTLVGASLLVSAILLVIQGPLELTGYDPILGFPAELRGAFGVIDIVDGITSFIVAFGLLMAKRWAWKWGIIEMYATIGLAVMFVALRSSDLDGYVSRGIMTPIMIVMIRYFYRPHVRVYFGKIPSISV